MPQVSAALQEANSQPNSFEAQMRAASLYYQIRNFDKAIEFYQKANKIKPDDYDTIVQLGNVNFDGGNYEEAEKWYTTALSKKPDDISVRTDLGLTFVFRNQPDYDRAIKEFLGSLQRDPNHKQTLQNITYAYIQKGEIQKAKESLDKLEKVDPGNPAIANLRSEIEKKTSKS
jgi:tetratricopeptide (TPR) repeat protein